MPKIVICRCCGDRSERQGVGRPPSYCSEACRLKSRKRACVHCGAVFLLEKPTSKARFCSKPCFYASRTGVAQAPRRFVAARPCGVCGRSVTGPANAPLCSSKCRAIRKAARDQASGRRRRALVRGAASEPYTTEEIAERDRHVCQLCDSPVEMSLHYLDPWAPSIDHRVPLSKGGDDTRANVQLAHRRCNTAKGARVEAG